MTDRSDLLTALFEEYPGDEAWEKFVTCFPEVNADFCKRVAVTNDIVRVLYWKKGDNLNRVEEWVDSKIPALDGRSPRDILSLDRGETILRTAIMRMP